MKNVILLTDMSRINLTKSEEGSNLLQNYCRTDKRIKTTKPCKLNVYRALSCGDKEFRTPDLLNAIQALYQAELYPLISTKIVNRYPKLL